ncbi:MAG TPA: hypothetical protein VK761_02525, partial [Solirubrobacteraceae bacterium]|nr:hypothetical protein [Solirubrobacteraceae bacterium]
MASRLAEPVAVRPRLLLLTPDFPPAPGGIQVVAERLASEMDAFDTLVVAPAVAGSGAFDATSGLRVQRVAGAERLRGGRKRLLANPLRRIQHKLADLVVVFAGVGS